MSKAKKVAVENDAPEVNETDAQAAEVKRLQDEEKAEAKRVKEAEKAQKDEAKKADKEAKAVAIAQKKEADKQAKTDAKAAKIAEKEASKMPESNGVRRPKPDTLCGKAWAIFDGLSASTGSPATIGDSLKVAAEQSLNEGNVRAEYARWRKFFGVSGRLATPKSAEQTATETA